MRGKGLDALCMATVLVSVAASVVAGACPRVQQPLPVLDDIWPHVSDAQCTAHAVVPQATVLSPERASCTMTGDVASTDEREWLKTNGCGVFVTGSDPIFFPGFAGETSSTRWASSSYVAQLTVQLEVTSTETGDGSGGGDAGPLLPIYKMEEGYAVTTSYGDGELVLKVEGRSVFGIRRGLSAFSQLILPVAGECVSASDAGTIAYAVPLTGACGQSHPWTDRPKADSGSAPEKTHLTTPVPVWSIAQTPRFPWRGLMVDVARHYQSLSSLKRIVDIMSLSDLNVLHIHLVDAISFPFVPPSLPSLGYAGAFDADAAVYTEQDLKSLVTFAGARGVRVVPEIDVPGHAYSWGLSNTTFVADCPLYDGEINNIPLSPVYGGPDAVDAVLRDVTSIFPDAFVHVGGDEVVERCFSNDTAILSWMNKKGIDSARGVHEWWTGRILTSLERATQAGATDGSVRRTAVVWDEALRVGIPNSPLPLDVFVEVWQGHGTLSDAVEAGYTVINTFGNYLDMQVPSYKKNTYYKWVDTWRDLYTNPAAEKACDANRNMCSAGGLSPFCGQ